MNDNNIYIGRLTLKLFKICHAQIANMILLSKETALSLL